MLIFQDSILVIVEVLITIYVQIFEVCNFRGFLDFREIFILKISLVKLWLSCVSLITKCVKFLRLSDPQKYSRENSGFVASLKFTYLKNLYVDGSSFVKCIG